MDARSRDVKREGLAKPRWSSTPQAHVAKRPLAVRGLGLAEDFIGQVRGDGNAEAFTLVGLDHKQDPQDHTEEMSKTPKCVAEREARPASGDEAQPEEITQNFAEYRQGTENNN